MKNIFEGSVVHGKEEGRKLGFPTANVEFKGEIKEGIYAGWANVEGKKYKAGILYRRGTEILEAYLIDFSGDLYGKKVELEITERIRDLFDEGDKDKWIGDIKKTIEEIEKLLAEK